MMDWVERSDAFLQADSWLKGIHERLRSGRVEEDMAALYQGLHWLRRKCDREEWHVFCLESTRAHPLRELLHQCPYSRHSYERPRGYAGDADLIDYVYEPRLTGAPPLGQAIYRFLFEQTGPQSVRERRLILAREIDTIAERVKQPKVLSIACGHLREAELSRAVAERRVGQFLAVDQDQASLDEVARRHVGGVVRPVCDTVRSIVLGRTVFEPQDLIYTAGLYDYLSQCTAQRLTQRLFHMLRPGGRLVIANFALSTPDAGYLEAFMDWWLVYRDEAEMRGLAQGIDPKQVGAMNLFRDSVGHVIYLELERR
ncbi:class I SAM-dependent methyltransferase [Archangium primigenium]|nr:class I SAM-dependent methyltransferase [Archangium primigenium]